MTEEKTEPTGPKITRREFLGEAVKLGLGVAVGASLANKLEPSTAKAQQTQAIEEKIQKELDRRQQDLEEINKQIEEVSEDDLDALVHVAQKRSIALVAIMIADPAVARDVMEDEATVKARDTLELKLPQDIKNRDLYIEQEFSQPWVGNYSRVSGIQRGKYPDRSFTPPTEEDEIERSYGLHTDQDLQEIPSGITIQIKEGTILGFHILARPDAIKLL